MKGRRRYLIAGVAIALATTGILATTGVVNRTTPEEEKVAMLEARIAELERIVDNLHSAGGEQVVPDATKGTKSWLEGTRGWTQVGDVLYPTMTGWRLAIGVTTTTRRVEIAGGSLQGLLVYSTGDRAILANATVANTPVIHSFTSATGATGVFGSANATSGRGVFGESGASVGPTHGVFGHGVATVSGLGYGVFGEASSNPGSTGHGVHGTHTGMGTGFGVWFAGGLGGTGTKSAIVRTSEGPRKFYCLESPEVWFEDFGEAELKNGHARIELDRLFLEAVTINRDHPMLVFIQPLGNCNGLYVVRDETGFDVYELMDGKSNIRFAYRLVAKRKGYEDLRLEPSISGYYDSYLYPDPNDPDIPAEIRAIRLAQIENDRQWEKGEEKRRAEREAILNNQ